MQSKHLVILFLFSFLSCHTSKNVYHLVQEREGKLAKFEPTTDVLLFVGQDLEAIGGIDSHSNGYLDNFHKPDGITLYTNLSPGLNSYGYYFKGLDGLETNANWGAGDSCLDCILDESTFSDLSIAIGLSMVNHEKNVAKGKHDELVVDLAIYLKSLRRPVFLRIGYEFDGHDWNHYDRTSFLKAWKRIHSKFKELEVENVAFVWQSKGTGSTQSDLENWYPGDEFVDWCAYSYFSNPDEQMLHFARRHNKPVFIAEATPILELDGLILNSDIKNERIAKEIWKKWFLPFFNTIQNNRDVIKGFSYINSNWSNQMMWKTNPLFKQVDSRIQMSEYISEKWRKALVDLKAKDNQRVN